MKKIIHTSEAPSAIGPYSQATLVNGTLYISGQIPVDPENGKLVEGIQKETHQVMKNLKAILKAAERLVAGSSTPNSSPPMRATKSPARPSCVCRAWATVTRHWSPMGWP